MSTQEYNYATLNELMRTGGAQAIVDIARKDPTILRLAAADDGRAIIHDLANDEDLPQIKELIAKDPSLLCVADRTGWTPLHFIASDLVDITPIENVLRKDPSLLEIPAHNGTTPIELAQDGDHRQILLLWQRQRVGRKLSEIIGRNPTIEQKQKITELVKMLGLSRSNGTHAGEPTLKILQKTIAAF